MGSLEVHVVTPEREVWTGEASALIARTVEGDVGILPGHVPFLAALDIGALYIDAPGGRVGAAVDGGFLHVTGSLEETRVDVLAEHAELGSEIDVEEARRRRDDAQRRLGEEQSDEARAELAKAIARLRVREQP
jgi:F-type H+-transporting ATPase subunit epsilon